MEKLWKKLWKTRKIERTFEKFSTLPEIVHHDISDIYGVYLTASTLGIVSERDIAICNKKISKVIRKAKTFSILKLRVAIERK